MRLTLLMKGNALSSLWNAEKIVSIDGDYEETNTGLNRSSLLKYSNFIIGNSFLYGERNLLSLTADYVIDGNKIIRSENLFENFPSIKFKGKTVTVGFCPEIGEIACISTLHQHNSLQAIYPLPFRDSSIDEILFYEVLDYDIMREANRILKIGGRVYLIIRDQVFGGIDPRDSLKFLLKFYIESAQIKDNFWIIKAKKIRN